MKTDSLIVNLVSVCLLLLITIACNPNRSGKNGKELTFPTNLAVIEPSGSIKFDSSWMDSKYKVVVFIEKAGRHSTMELDWQTAISENKDVAFLFFVSEKDSSKLIQHMKEVNFSHPLLWDPDKKFYKSNIIEDNLSFISFLVREDRIIEMGNPTVPNFQERLDELTKE